MNGRFTQLGTRGAQPAHGGRVAAKGQAGGGWLEGARGSERTERMRSGGIA